MAICADGEGFKACTFVSCKFFVLLDFAFDSSVQDGAKLWMHNFHGGRCGGVPDSGVCQDGAVGQVVSAVWALARAIVRFLFPRCVDTS